MTSITSLCEMACQVVQKKLEEKQLEEERAAKAKYWKLPICYDDDDDEERSNSLDDNIISGLPPFSAITPDEPVLSTEEPDNSLSMGDEHLDTIPATQSDEFIKSGVEDLIPIPSESEGIPEHMCDVPSHDNSLPLDISKDQFEDFYESNDEFSSTDDYSFSFDKIDYVEVSPLDSELLSSEVMEIVIPEVGGIEASNDNPIPFYDPIISGTPPNLTPSGESDFFLEDMLLLEAFLNDDHSSDFKTKSSSTSLNSLLEETHNFDNSLPEFTIFLKVLFDAECESNSSDDQSCSDEDVLKKIVSKPMCEEEIIPMKSLYIRLIEKLLYDNSSSRPLKEFVSANSDAKIKSFSPSPILVKDSDSLMKEINLFCTPDNLMSNNTLSFAEKELFHFDIPSFSRPPAKPPDELKGLKNHQSLLNIDCKVESVMGFKYKCFLDAYKGYHQIQMSKEDEEKSTFYTYQGTYCYTKMSYELKHAGTTYQRLIDSTFQVEEGKFFGYMVTSKGIRANPMKTRVLADLQSPCTLKEMHSFGGKFVALNRFLAKSAERSLPLFNTLKNITKENKHEYKLTIDAKEAFQQMKRCIINLPSLTPLFLKETLYAYLAVSKETEVIVEVLNERSTEGKEINTVVDEEGYKLMMPIIRCLEKGVWLEDKNEARNLRLKINQYAMENGVLFKKSYMVPML
nr:hypothetical protein [Tanacetum cinerariifolium]